jgi:hypothetical protein
MGTEDNNEQFIPVSSLTVPEVGPPWAPRPVRERGPEIAPAAGRVPRGEERGQVRGRQVPRRGEEMLHGHDEAFCLQVIGAGGEIQKMRLQ